MTRPPDPTFDQRIADWLEDDPIHAPREVLGTVLAALPSIDMRPASRVPWRYPTVFNNRLLAAAVAVVVVVGGGIALTRTTGPGGPSTPPSLAPTADVTAPPPTSTPAATVAAARMWHGKILVEHFGNAPDGSENAPDGSEMRHRLYLVDPNNMTRTGYTELLPDQPASGKSSADVSRDGTKVVFQDWADPSSIYVANIDGTGFQKLTPSDCGCSEWDPAFDSTATKVVYGHGEGNRAWLEVLDLATGARTTVPNTTGSSKDNVVESPSWSPDGTRIAFVRTAWGGQEATMGLVHYDGSQSPSGAMLTIVQVADGTMTHFETGDSVMGTLIPGDPFFSPDGATMLFMDRPYTKQPRDPAPGAYTMRLDGTSLTQVVPTADGASLTSDGTYVLSTYNFFSLRRVDGAAGGGLVDEKATDNTEGDVGFIYVGFWVGNP